MTTVIVGAGVAGVQVAAALREQGHHGRVVLIGAEAEMPYRRPPLSKAYLTDPDPADPVLRSAEFFDSHTIELRTGTQVRGLDLAAGSVLLADGEQVAWTDLVLATGTRTRALRVPGADLAGVTALRTLADARRLRSAVSSARRVVVIGGGFIGVETAGAALASGAAVTVVEAGPRLLGRSVTACTAAYLLEHHRRAGIDVRLGASVTELLGRAGHVTAVRTADGRCIDADLVVIGVGVTACDELAGDAGLATDDGILVDSSLRASHPHVYAVGDCARFPMPDGQRVRLESVQNATDQARHVASTIATGEHTPYHAVPWFWSNQKGARLQIAGLGAAADDVVITGNPADMAFAVHCFHRGVLVAVETVNRPTDHMAARRLLAADRPTLRDDFESARKAVV